MEQKEKAGAIQRFKMSGKFLPAVLDRMKKTFLIWIAVYPAVLLVLTFLGDLLRDWSLPLRVLGATAMIVPIIANITDPAVKAAVAAVERGLEKRAVLPKS